MSKLYELTEEFLQLMEMAADPDIDPEALADTMEGLHGEIEEKADGYAKVIRTLASDSENIDNEIKRLQQRKQTINNNIDRMKKSLQGAMEVTGKTKFKTALFSFGIQNNPASVVIDDETKIPVNFLVPQPPKIDKIGIKKSLNDGAEFDFAHMEQTRSLRIR